MSHKKHAISGAKWMTLSMVIVTALQMTQMVVLARLLTPEAFGTIALLMIVIGLADLQTQLGLHQVIIQDQHLTQTQTSSLYWLSISLGIIMYIIINVGYFIGGLFFYDPQLHGYLETITLAFIILPLGGQFSAQLQKNFKFKQYAQTEVIGAVTGVITAITLAINDYGIWSLILAYIARCTVLSLTLIIFGFKNQFKISAEFSLAAIRNQLKFALNLLGGNLLNFLTSRVDQMLVGLFLGAQALGYYSMAFNLIIQPILKLNPIITRVALPIMSQLRTDKQALKQGYFTLLDIICSFNAPVFLGVLATASMLIPVVIGPQWLQVTPILQTLCIYAFFYSIFFSGISFVIASGQSHLVFRWNIITAVTTTITVLIATQVGDLLTVAQGLCITQLGLVFLWYRQIVNKIIDTSFIEMIITIAKPFLIASCMSLIVISTEIQTLTDSELLKLIMSITIGMFAYIGLSILFRPEIKYAIKKRLK
ncbi:MOP flippase family protein [Shewanella aestuarii]|uniref:MOP flippase family protein n=1 Tax=Shewanella aestuarii TaxID=1028752 RepID=A0A6G9QMN1_9GAMM|nr:MOP flippase family protein [Shewanella aestuarii]QIR15099.1 MOP flippase family protein [Shewanella aestuarii]